MGNKLTVWILVALGLGLVLGLVMNATMAPADAKAIGSQLTIITDVFLRLIKMIIAPLVFATLVAGIAGMGGDSKSLGRIGVRTIAWFLAATVVSITLGLLAVNTLQPGVGLNLSLPVADAATAVKTEALTFRKVITEIFPKSIVDAMATNNILQIVVFAVFFGIALAKVGERGRPLVKAMEVLMEVMLVITNIVMWVAPFAVFAAVTATVAEQGVGILATYGAFMGGFYATLLILLAIILTAGGLVIGFGNIPRLVREIREPFLLAFSTASSEAAYPRFLAALERFGVPNRIASFTLPLGYSFNLDGSMLYCSFATVFIAQAYGIDLTLTQEITMLLFLMVASKGMASVPRASLVVITATLSFFGLPTEGVLLILAVDHFLDMGRSATNVVGNAVATAVVAKWEGELGRPEPAVLRSERP
ncbi:dicarboxylate/amino acid:cation symporter [Sandaracinobacteroides saxicola]|uniref:Dicarboxylate/amino acid:cation symporter n=1 Tax=Sandaracinobacteroides saxicola TaxID=2759707 RepID=A0A7G5IKB4_9SPHN|nr:dicarboxylate/amino acid:cation symporter [Sandaracinobacteroides saxicola]QMW23806.1 dicarboxylate/amino acid:cation symporter [Sandaracinobacteroides saxicola]